MPFLNRLGRIHQSATAGTGEPRENIPKDPTKPPKLPRKWVALTPAPNRSPISVDIRLMLDQGKRRIPLDLGQPSF